MLQIDYVIARLRAFRRHVGWSGSALARRSGLSLNSLRGMDRPEWSPRASTLRALEEQVPPTFIVTDGPKNDD